MPYYHKKKSLLPHKKKIMDKKPSWQTIYTELNAC